MTKASNAEPDRVAALEGTARQGGADVAGETTLSLRSNAATPDDKSSLVLWLWVAGGFLLLVIAWTVMFTAAHSAKIESVPLATNGGHR